ncbi:MAG: DUF4838 domain-containing protein [Clostridia bacterium]|nr:DUF4838 domain-containing protein [Clostridia bacterium]
MYFINKVIADHVVDFAAEELKKYLRMMMPRCGEIAIQYAPNAESGFRLGTMDAFGLDTSDAEDTELDDIIYISTDTEGGIIAGSNPRSVLLAVYRYLTINGCRWLFPGIDGEIIPLKSIDAVNYRKKADCRYRGQCNEGAESQPLMMEAIDFTPKLGLNIFMLEFDNPRVYYDYYYNHKGNSTVREPEPVSPDEVLQWKRQCEAEIAKRGLQLHDMGHGWTAEPFGIDSSAGWRASTDPNMIPEENREFIAMINGKRELFHGVPLNTNFCMSNPKAREKVVKYIADYAALATNVDYLHVWLADATNNHCECENCRQKIPTDWYITMMNEIDAELTSRGLNTRIVFICYTDTTWAPQTVRIINPKRFSLLLAAITRNYTEAVDPILDTDAVNLGEFQLNKNIYPKSVNEYIAHAKRWQEKCGTRTFVYEYHYWIPQYRDLGVLDASRMVYDDIRGYKANGCDGIVEDGSQRSFYPNGFSFFTYGSTLFDTDVDFDDLKADYFSHAYGDDWKDVVCFLNELGKLADFRYLNGKMSEDESKGAFYAPSLEPQFRKAIELANSFTSFVQAHKNMPRRAQTVAYRMLASYIDYCRGLLNVMSLKCVGRDAEAHKAFSDFLNDFGTRELEFERWYDQHMMASALGRIFN